MPISNNCNAVSHNIDMPISICKFPIKFLTPLYLVPAAALWGTYNLDPFLVHPAESKLGFINTIITDLSSRYLPAHPYNYKYLIHKLSKVKPAFYHGAVDSLLITIVTGTYYHYLYYLAYWPCCMTTQTEMRVVRLSALMLTPLSSFRFVYPRHDH